MLVAFDCVIGIWNSLINCICSLQIPTGNGTYFVYGPILIFFFLLKMAWIVIKVFLTKDHFRIQINRYGKD